MPKTRLRWTRFSKGELSPLLAGSSDLAQYFEGASTIENADILRQGGVRRRPGTRFIKEVKDSTKDTILWSFEFSVDDAYILEVGDLYIRVYKTKAPVLNVGVHVEIATPFVAADIRTIHFTQSADIVFTFHGSYQQRKLSRVSDISWNLSLYTATPLPVFDADHDMFSNMALGANAGSAVPFRLSSADLLPAEAGRQIIVGAGKATIVSFTDTSSGTVNILEAFSQTITAGPSTISTTGTAAASTAHGLSAGNFLILTSGPQSGQLRRAASVTDADNFVLDAAFSVNQAGQTWNKIIQTTAGAWFLRLSPMTSLDPNIKGPIGSQVTMVAGANAWRVEDIGKYVSIYAGIVKLTHWDSATTMRGTIEKELSEATVADPPAVPEGAWFLQQASWSSTNGYPRTGEFFQGRLAQASTIRQPTTWWMSVSDDYENYGLGITAEDAVEYTIASRQVNRIEWLTEKNKSLFIGTAGSEHQATGSGNTDALIGGDTIPIIDRLATNGVAPIQPVMARQSIIYVDRSRRKIMLMGFDLESDGQTDKELTVGAEHITESGVAFGPMAFEKRLDPRIYFTRDDGKQVAMTFFPEQKVVAFSRRTTDGIFFSQAAIPDAPWKQDQVWCTVLRLINGVPKVYVEMFETNHELLPSGRSAMQTDCGIVLTGITGTTVTGLGHLEAKTVDFIKNGSYQGQFVVSSGAITLPAALVPADVIEVGLHYETTIRTMEPAIQGQVIDGLPRTWDSLYVRLDKSHGGKINGEPIQYPQGSLDAHGLFTGILKVSTQNVDADGRVTITQHQPYPQTILGLFGTVTLGEMD